MLVDSIVILRQCCPHPIASRVEFTPPEVLQVERRCRLITAPVKNNHPLLSEPLSALICDKKLYPLMLRLLRRADNLTELVQCRVGRHILPVFVRAGLCVIDCSSISGQIKNFLNRYFAPRAKAVQFVQDIPACSTADSLQERVICCSFLPDKDSFPLR